MPIPVEAVEMSEINTQQHQQQEKPNHFDAIERSKNHALVARPSSAIEGGLVPMDIVFTQLNWVVNVKNPSKDAAAVKANPTIEKKVLNQVSGVFRPGKLTAVMGASGAGKTTLLNVIAGYGSGGRTEGDILVNGEKVDSSFMRELSGFVHQSDVILESMTVREALALAAHLRLPRSMSFEEKNNRVEEILRWLNLVKCADNQIGSPEKKGISGGERRRVSIGMELVRNVSTLFLDEPTSGLDSFTAYNVGHLLRTVAHQHNRTIVATIHQPSSEIFQLFDELVLLHLGRVIYHGPADEVMNYFHKYLNYTIPKYINPADFIFMSILNDAGRQAAIGVNRSSLLPGTVDIEKGGKPEADPSAVHAKREESLISMWNDGKNETDGSYSYPLPRQQLDLNIKESSSLGRKLPDRKEMALNYSTFWTQFYFLCRRAFFDVIRNPFKLRARIGQASFMALLAALCYLHAGYDQASVQNRRGVLFFFCAGGTMNATMGTLMIFTPEKAVFRREYSSRMYSLPSFFFSKMAMELPLRIIMPIWMALIVYWAVGLQNDAEHFFIFASTLILIDLVGNGLGTLFASIFPSLPIALAASPMVLLPLMLFSGFFLNSDSIPPYFEWISYLSPIKYGFTALAKNEFPGLTFHCGDQTTNSVSACPYKTGDDVIRQLNFDSQPSLAENEGILLALAVGFFTLAYIVLWRTSKSI